MPQESTTASAIELTRRAFTSANSADFDAMMSFLSPDCVWDATSWGLGTHAGLVAIRNFIERWIGSFDEQQVVVEDILDLGNGIVFAVATQYAHTEGSRGRLRLRSATIFVWAEGMATRVLLDRDIEEARAAAEGLAQERG